MENSNDLICPKCHTKISAGQLILNGARCSPRCPLCDTSLWKNDNIIMEK